MDILPETLQQKQARFASMVGLLLTQIPAMGYACTLGEAYRTPEQAALNAKTGAGIAHSLHCQRLAIDLNIFKDGVYLSDTKDLTPIGSWWESIGGTWGGRFVTRPDGNHFSLANEGYK